MKRFFLLLASLGLILMGQQDGCLEDADGDGYTQIDDCDDSDASIYPGAEELCNGIDDNCDQQIDESFDLDGDGYTSCDTSDNPADCDDESDITYPGALEACDGEDNNCDGFADETFDLDLDGYTSCEGDCNDADATINPDAVEICDGLDNNCDGFIDEGYDLDADGMTSCGGDCDDANPEIYEGGLEVCDGLDNDCNGLSDEDFDLDGDGYSSCGGDCNDSDSLINPDVSEVCDEIDNNCDGQVDEGVQTAYYLDADGDGYGANDTEVLACEAPTSAYIETGDDCDDLNMDISPGTAEVCNGIDDNCNDLIDEGFDEDGDGITTCAGDCNDLNDTIYPGAVDICDGIDSDCDGTPEDSCTDPTADIAFTVEGVDAGSIGAWAYGTEPLTVHFDAAGSFDGDGGEIVEYQWDFGDGNFGSGMTISHDFYSTVSTDRTLYIVYLTVVDDEGATNVISMWVTACGVDYTGSCAP